MSRQTLDPPDPDKLDLNTATLRPPWTLREIVEACARHHIRAIAPWRDRIREVGLREAAAMFRHEGLAVSSLCGGGMFPAADRRRRLAALDENRRAVDEAAGLEAACLVLPVGGLAPGSKDLPAAREQVRDGLGELLEHARGSGVALAIEPQHPMFCADQGCINTMAQALDLCDELDSRAGGALGVALDVYHLWWDPGLREGIERAGERRLLCFQLADWLVPTRELGTDRGMMGDGVIDLPCIRDWVHGAGYRGFHEVEILSAQDWWRRDPDEVLSTCRRRHQLAC
jgi:sugar phosphate isomerase/epimerase